MPQLQSNRIVICMQMVNSWAIKMEQGPNWGACRFKPRMFHKKLLHLIAIMETHIVLTPFISWAMKTEMGKNWAIYQYQAYLEVSLTMMVLTHM